MTRNIQFFGKLSDETRDIYWVLYTFKHFLMNSQDALNSLALKSAFGPCNTVVECSSINYSRVNYSSYSIPDKVRTSKVSFFVSETIVKSTRQNFQRNLHYFLNTLDLTLSKSLKVTSKIRNTFKWLYADFVQWHKL